MDPEQTQAENGGALAEQKVTQEVERGDDNKSQDMPYSDLSAKAP